jgi:hypothetical protein
MASDLVDVIVEQCCSMKLLVNEKMKLEDIFRWLSEQLGEEALSRAGICD